MAGSSFLRISVIAILAQHSLTCTIIKRGLSCRQKKLILDSHNEYRNRVAGGEVSRQPSAANMLELTWDNTVAVHAQKWTDGCEFSHDPKLNSREQGQNLAITYGYPRVSCNDQTIKSLLKSWFDENRLYTFNTRFSSKTGHYTQVVWGTTATIGCGLTYYKKDGYQNCFLSCNYSPPGNYIGQYPYKTGSRNCEANSWYRSYTYSNLCSIYARPKKTC